MRTSAGMEAGSGNENLNKLCATNGFLFPSTRNPSATYLFTNDFGYSKNNHIWVDQAGLCDWLSAGM